MKEKYNFLNFEYPKNNNYKNSPDFPALIIPNSKGTNYSIQYNGCACLHCFVTGNIYKLPNTRFNNYQRKSNNPGTLFNPDLWYYHGLSALFYDYPKLIYDLIDKELADRCSDRLDAKFKPVWVGKYQNITCDRKFKQNREAMVVVNALDIETNSKIKAILTWQNCD